MKNNAWHTLSTFNLIGRGQGVYTAHGISVPWPGIEPRSWQGKFRILTTRPPGNAPNLNHQYCCYYYDIDYTLKTHCPLCYLYWWYFHVDFTFVNPFCPRQWLTSNRGWKLRTQSTTSSLRSARWSSLWISDIFFWITCPQLFSTSYPKCQKK